jgi:hypothetical protein
MSLQLDHLFIPSKNKNASAQRLGELLGVRWEPAGEGPAPDVNQPPPAGLSATELFRQYHAQRASVYVNDSLTIDFVDAQGEVTSNHYCFSVSDSEFDAILARIKESGLSFLERPLWKAGLQGQNLHGWEGSLRYGTGRPLVGNPDRQLRPTYVACRVLVLSDIGDGALCRFA